MTSRGSFFSFYQKRFLPAYLRMKFTLRDGKPLPQPIADGITDSFTHLSHSYDTGSELLDQASISLALDALIETTYLCYQIVVISIGSEISAVCEDPRKARFCVNMNYNDFKREYAKFKTTGNEAKRLSEMKSEASCKEALGVNEDAIAIGESLLDKIDWIKIEDTNLEREQAETLSAVQEESKSNKNKIIELLDSQVSLHPKRSFAVIAAIFIASGFVNAFLKDIYDQMLAPYILQSLQENGINLTALIQR